MAEIRTSDKTHSTGGLSVMMTIRERRISSATALGSTISANAPFSPTASLFGAFRRSIGFGEANKENLNYPNCVYANWPMAKKEKIGIEEDENDNNSIFVTLKNSSVSTSTTAEDANNSTKTFHLQLEQDISLERRILSIPTHILRWIGFDAGDEVHVKLNSDLSRGFCEGKENLMPSISYTISRILVQVKLATLREISKLSLRADSLADFFRQTFLHDVLNVGQCCILEFECNTKNNTKNQQNEGRKRKFVEMKEQRMENDFEPPQPKKGLAATAIGALMFGWTANAGSADQKIQQKCTIEAKIITIHRTQPQGQSDVEAQYGLIKEGTQILLCPIAESGLSLYGDPALICSTVPINAEVIKRNAEKQNKIAKDGEKKTTESTNQSNNKNQEEEKENTNNTNNENVVDAANAILKLKVKQYDREFHTNYKDNKPPCLVHQQDYDIVAKKKGQVGGVVAIAGSNSNTPKCYALIGYKNQENQSNENSTTTIQQENEFIWDIVNQTDYSFKGERGIIFMSYEFMDCVKIKIGDEVTLKSYDLDGTKATRIGLKIVHCDGGPKCQLFKPNTSNSKTIFFHANDIANSLRKIHLRKPLIFNNSPTHLIVEDNEMKNRLYNSKKKNIFDGEGANTPQNSCIKFQIIEMEANITENKNTTQSTDETTAKQQNVSNPKYATVQKDTVIKIKDWDETLSIFGIEHQSMITPPKLLLQNIMDLHKKVGGLDEQLSEIFRRAFASRMISADCTKQMGIKHLRGILLYGPPGTGKTLIARELAKALNSREPKIINGAEVQSMWFGQSEKNVRSLFVDAEREQALAGDQSRLHVIIIDELDALCPNRENTMSNHRTEQRIVNTLLAKLDGVEQLDNILLIGMTNLMETIDPALLRPGRMELKIRIGLPNEKGRHEILDIHTKTMREANRLNEDVDLAILAKKTVNFSGAELEGLVRAAQSQAIQRIIKSGEPQTNQTQNRETTTIMALQNDKDLKICAADFELAFENDIEPAFGKGSMDGAQLKAILCREPILWSSKIEKLLEKSANLVEELRKSDASTIGHSRLMLLNGPRQSGKTFLATTIAQHSGIPYIRLVTADFILREKNPTATFDKIISDCENTDFACIIFDEIEQIIGYNECSQNWQHVILRKLAILLNREPSKEKCLFLLATSCEKPEWFEQMHLQMCLQNRVELPTIRKCDDVIQLLGAATKKSKASENEGTPEKLFTKCELDAIAKAIEPELGGGLNIKLMPSIKDLVKLIDWYSKQHFEEAKSSSSTEQTTVNSTETMPSTLFEKFKQHLLQLISQKRNNVESLNSTTHLSMYG